MSELGLRGRVACVSRVCEHSNRQCLGQPSGPLGWWSKTEKVVLALPRGVYGGPYQGDVGSYGVPVASGDSEHSDALAKQVLLESDALVAGYEEVIAVLYGVSDQVFVPQGLPAQVLGGMDLVVQKLISQPVGSVVVQQDLQ